MSSLKAEYGKKEYAKKNYFSQKDGDVVYRIIPAQSQFTDNGRDWVKYHSVVFGYKNTEGKVRPFESVRVKRDGVISVEDPAVKRVEDLKAKLDQAKKDENHELVAKLNTLVGFGGTYSVDNNYHMNVIDLQGNIGVLKIRKTAKDALDAEIAKLESAGVDPLSEDNGRFFVFNRTGSGNQTSFKVDVYKQKINSPEYGLIEKDFVHKITPDIQAKINREAQDLSKIAIKLTPEEVARIVASADIQTGKTPVCNELFDNRWKAEREARGGNQRQESAPVTNNAPTPTATPSARVTPVTPTPLAAPTSQAANEDPFPSITPVTALPTTNTAYTAQVTASAPTAPTFVAEQSHEDWLKEIGIDTNS